MKLKKLIIKLMKLEEIELKEELKIKSKNYKKKKS
jgi:hypothetical protein